MLEAITHQPRTQLIAKNYRLNMQEETQLRHWIDKQVLEHMPLQYLIGSTQFLGLEILVRPPVLIPRPETEQWVDELIEQFKSISAPLTLLDLCTGSGCIALALAKALPTSQIYAIDIAPESIALAEENKKLNKLMNVRFLQSDLFSSIEETIKFDLITANPPYISKSEWQTLEERVKRWESAQALIGGATGLAVIKKIIDQAPAYLKKDSPLLQHKIPQLVIEIGHNQGSLVKKLAEDAQYCTILIDKDYQGHDRVAKIYREC